MPIKPGIHVQIVEGREGLMRALFGDNWFEERMPYKSLAQERYFNANRSKIGASVVDEFNRASKGKKLPKRKRKKRKAA